MNFTELQKEFKQKVCNEIDIEPQGVSRFVVYTPFMFDDGDHFVIVLKRSGKQWILTDEGHTFMHMSYGEIDISHGTRKSIIDQTLLNFAVANESGELYLDIPDEAYGDALFSFIQALVKISDTAYWTRERIKSTFFEDFRRLLEYKIPSERRVFEYHDSQNDPDKNYLVDCKVNGMKRPVFIFGINNDAKCQTATICMHQFEKWGLEFRTMAIFEDQTQINRKVLARFSDMTGNQFSSLGAKDRIGNYLNEILQES